MPQTYYFISLFFSHSNSLDIIISVDLQDFNDQSIVYHYCFPPSKIQEWFSHQNLHGNSVTIDLPSNLYHDNNWMGLVLYASFSIHGDPNIILKNRVAESSDHFLYCQCQMMPNMDDEQISCHTRGEEITWLLNLGEFIWVCYVPGEIIKNLLDHSSHTQASFVSDWPDLIVHKCALRLLYQHDQVQFNQELQDCMIVKNLVCKKFDKKRGNKQNPVDEVGVGGKFTSNTNFEPEISPIYQPETQLCKSDLLVIIHEL